MIRFAFALSLIPHPLLFSKQSVRRIADSLETELMNINLRQLAGILVAIGAVAMLVTLFGMITAFQSAQADLTPVALAESLSISLIPSTLGFPRFAIGLVLFIVDWLRARKMEPAAIS